MSGLERVERRVGNLPTSGWIEFALHCIMFHPKWESGTLLETTTGPHDTQMIYDRNDDRNIKRREGESGSAVWRFVV